MHYRTQTLLSILLTITLFVSGVDASTVEVSPTGSNDQVNINKAINAVAEAGGGTVYLNAGVYDIADTVVIKSHIKLLGDPNAEFVVSAASQWFVGQVGVISSGDESLKDVEIGGFKINGNIKNLNPSYSDSRSDTAHDCEKLILIGGWSGDFGNNIRIHHMTLYNSFSDGIYVRFSSGVSIDNNKISNCQHEGFYLSCVTKSVAYNNKIAGITSDAGRLDNCVDCAVFSNLFFSYGGPTYGANPHGENGLQISDAGSSHGYDGTNKPLTTKNIEVYNNTFVDPGLKAIWLDSSGRGVENVYVHDNFFKDATVLETMGIPIGDISIDNQPSVEMSEKVFSTIFDIYNVDFFNSGMTAQQDEQIQYKVTPTEQGNIAGGVKIIGFKNKITIENQTFIQNESSAIVKTSAIMAPRLDAWNVGTDRTTDEVSVKIEDGKASAVYTVNMRWYRVSVNQATKETKKKFHTSKATFTDTVDAPQVLPKQNVTAYVDVYPSENFPKVRVRVPHNNLTQRIDFKYKDVVTTHTFLVGERRTDKNGVVHTLYSRVNSWSGNMSSMGDEFIVDGPFDPTALSLTYSTPYEDIKIDDVRVSVHELQKDTWAVPQLGFILRLFFMLFILLCLFRVATP